MGKRYEGSGATLEAAVHQAHRQIPAPPPGKDFTVSKVVEWGMQYGGFVSATIFYVIVEEDPDAKFRTEHGADEA